MDDTTEADLVEALQDEFSATPGTFLFYLRGDAALSWNDQAFDRLVEPMRRYCELYAGRDTLQRWAAAGYWFVSWFVADWSSHPNFPRAHEPEYYQRAYLELSSLADRFFYDAPDHPRPPITQPGLPGL